jgi:hypothetical protein
MTGAQQTRLSAGPGHEPLVIPRLRQPQLSLHKLAGLAVAPDAADPAVPLQAAALPPMGTKRANAVSRDADPDIEPLLLEVRRREWMLICCGRRAQPDALVAVHRAEFWADVVALRGHDRAAAYRTLIRPHDDPLQATHIVWHYLSDAERTLRAVLNIPPEAVASTPYPIPEDCRIPEVQHRPATIRLGRQAYS